MRFRFLPLLKSTHMPGLSYMTCWIGQAMATCLQYLFQVLIAPSKLTKPTNDSLLWGAATDLVRSKQELVVENALLRQQLIVLRRQVKRPQLRNSDRALLLLLISKLRMWKGALLIIQPDTLLRWHSLGFRLFWKRKSKAKSRKAKLAAETIELIKQLAQENRLWGAERIRGELLKLDIHVCKRTIQN